jgi:hypothetical protein
MRRSIRRGARNRPFKSAFQVFTATRDVLNSGPDPGGGCVVAFSQSASAGADEHANALVASVREHGGSVDL